jgi:hypothetical protein
MNYQQLCKRIFSVDKRIRYVTVTDASMPIEEIGGVVGAIEDVLHK